MSRFSNTPAFMVVLPFMGGLVLAYYVDFSLLLVFLLALLIFIFIFLLRLKPDLTQWLLILLFILIGIARLEFKTLPAAQNHIAKFADLPDPVTIEGILTKPVERSGTNLSAVLRADSIWVLHRAWATNGKCLLKIYQPCDSLTYGSRIVARGQLRLPAGERNPGAFNYKKYLAAQDIHAVFRVTSAQHVVRLNENEGRPILRKMVYPVRHAILQVIDDSLDGQPAALLKALLVGVRGELDTDIREAFGNAGVIHVLAVSGLHVGFVLIGLIGLFSFLHIPNPWRIILVMLCLIFYAFLTGLKPSVCRATVMAIVFLGGQLLQRRAHLLNTLSIAALFILFISPLDLFEPGFQLSFAAVLGIIFIYQRLSKLSGPFKARLSEHGRIFYLHVVNLFLVSVAAQVATIPLTIYYFNRFSLISFVANLIVIPAIAVSVALGMVAVLCSLFHPMLGGIYFSVVWLLLKAVVIFVDAAQNLPFAYFVVPQPSAWFVLFYLSGILLFVTWPKLDFRRWLVFAILVFANVFIWMQLGSTERSLKITFFDVGQGDSALFEFPNGRTMLIDAGDRTDYVDYGERVIYPYLVRNGIHTINDMIITHAHADHNGGVLFLLEKKCVGRLVKTHAQHEMELDSLIEMTAQQNNVPIRYIHAGDTLFCDPDLLVMALHPTPSIIRRSESDLADLNNVSIVLKCVYFSTSILMTGDAETAAEKSMLIYEDVLQSTILKCAHHGSSTSNSAAFRRAVSAQYGIVSVAQFNRFGLPSTHLMKEFQAEGTTIYRTDAGAVQFLITPTKITKLKKLLL